jgi:hypothetical protein
MEQDDIRYTTKSSCNGINRMAYVCALTSPPVIELQGSWPSCHKKWPTASTTPDPIVLNPSEYSFEGLGISLMQSVVYGFTWASSVLITHPILRIWPRRTTTCSLDWKKNNSKVAIFRPTRRSLLPRTPGWTDNLLITFLSGLQTLQQRSKKCIELRGEYVE